MPPLRITFCGTPAFALPALQALRDDPAFEVTHVITQPDRKAGRGNRITAPPVKECAMKLGIPVVQPEDIHAYHASLPAPHACDALVVVAYGQILSAKLLLWPRIAPVNVHPSLLPRWRGSSPIQHSILAGDSETGVTIQRMVRKLDSGPILAQEKIPLTQRETAESLEVKLAERGAVLLVSTLRAMGSAGASVSGIPQDESSATYCGKLTRDMGWVDPSRMTAEEIDRRVRAFVPWPGVRVAMRGKRGEKEIKLIETSLLPQEDSLGLPCKGMTTLYILKLQSPDRKVTTGAEWKRGKEALKKGKSCHPEPVEGRHWLCRRDGSASSP